jgi:hypothetical protein
MRCPNAPSGDMPNDMAADAARDHNIRSANQAKRTQDRAYIEPISSVRAGAIETERLELVVELASAVDGH